MRESKYEEGLLNGSFNDIAEIHTLLETDIEKVYEVIRIIDGKPLFLEDHIARMNNSIKLVDIDFSVSLRDIREQIYMLLDKFKEKNINVKITFFKNSVENLIIYLMKSQYPTVEKIQKGYNTILIYEERENPNAKILNNEFRGLINEILTGEDADECIYVSEKGEVLEGSRSNLFFVKGNTIVTASDNGVLLGTTRNKIVEICQEKRIGIQKRVIRIEELAFFDAAFITGTSIDVMPVNAIGTVKYKSTSNRLVERIRKEYEKEKHKYLSNIIKINK
ncbi:MAG: aminotransferase class IV [Dethiosulfatibacter sp.]|nr:aminotransferase class IV [Dethiosulfatibacter sp.]